MATLEKNGVIFDPSSGSGNSTQTVKLKTANPGNRTAIPVNVTYKAPGVANVVKTFNIEAAPEFVSYNDGTTMAVPKTGGTISVDGVSNSSKLTFSLGTGTLGLTLPSTYSAAGVSTTNDVAIKDDPGATAKFNFNIDFVNIPANTTITEKRRQVTVTTNGGKTATIDLVQAAGDPTLTVTPETTTIPQSGAAVNVQIATNTTWSVE